MGIGRTRLERVVCIVLGGGRGQGLYPLTRERAKAATPFAGKYRMIDIPVSNCINSGFHTIFILTHFNTPSLHSHIAETYHFDSFTRGSVKILASEYTLPHQSPVHEGPAQAVRQALEHFTVLNPTHYLILRGDLLFRMDLQKLFHRHRETRAEVTLAVKNYPAAEARGFACLETDPHGKITAYHPCEAAPPVNGEVLLDLGVGLYNAETLHELLKGTRQDFSRDILPDAVRERKVQSYWFNGFWEPVTDIGSFYRQNIALSMVHPQFNLYDDMMPIFHENRFLPLAKVNFSTLSQVLVGDGSILTNATAANSILGVRTVIGSGADLDGVVSLGADFYETEDQKARNRKDGIPDVGIGQGTIVRKTIIDKNARIGDGCRIGADPFYRGDWDYGNYCVREGIIIIPKGAVIPSGTVI